MPLWKIYHTPDAFIKQEEKDAVAQGATEFYTKAGLPGFYVHVLFFPVQLNDNFTAGRNRSKFVILEIGHIARNWNGDKKFALYVKKNVDRVMMPYTTDRGIHLEYAVLEGPAAMWRIDGIDPPEAFSAEEKEQAEINRKILQEKYEGHAALSTKESHL